MFVFRNLAGRRIAISLVQAGQPRLFSTAALPSNLKLAEDPNIFKPVPQPAIPRVEFLYPPLRPPSSLPVYKFRGDANPIETAALDPVVFGVAIRQDIVHEAVRYERNMMRQPHKTKRSFEIRGSTKKPYPQKGTGMAQAGNKRASHWRGGQKAHGPKLRNFEIGMNKKSRALATMIAVAAKQREGNLIIFDSFDCESHRTKDLVNILNVHGLQESKLMILDDKISENLECASRNLPLVSVAQQQHLRVFDLVRQEKLAVSLTGLKNLQTRLVALYQNSGKRKAFLEGINQMTNHPGFQLLKA